MRMLERRQVTFSAPPLLQWNFQRDVWSVEANFLVNWVQVENMLGTNLASFTVPAGFETDLASIPRAFRGIVPQVGRHIQAAITHDYIYSGAVFMRREDADLLFLDAMELLGVNWFRRHIMYRAVRTFGSLAWKGK